MSAESGPRSDKWIGARKLLTSTPARQIHQRLSQSSGTRNLQPPHSSGAPKSERFPSSGLGEPGQRTLSTHKAEQQAAQSARRAHQQSLPAQFAAPWDQQSRARHRQKRPAISVALATAGERPPLARQPRSPARNLRAGPDCAVAPARDRATATRTTARTRSRRTLAVSTVERQWGHNKLTEGQPRASLMVMSPAAWAQKQQGMGTALQQAQGLAGVAKPELESPETTEKHAKAPETGAVWRKRLEVCAQTDDQEPFTSRRHRLRGMGPPGPFQQEKPCRPSSARIPESILHRIIARARRRLWGLNRLAPCWVMDHPPLTESSDAALTQNTPLLGRLEGKLFDHKRLLM